MSAPHLVSQDLQGSPEPSQPRPVTGLAVAGLVLAAAMIALTALAASWLRSYNHNGPVSTIVAAVLVIGALFPLLPAFRAFKYGAERNRLLGSSELVAARRAAAAGREEAQVALGFAAGIGIIAGLLLFVLANHGAVAGTFFLSKKWQLAFPEMIRAFWTNIWVAVVAQVLVLIFGLLLAVMRMLPGRAGAPLRFIAMVYCDMFRAIPAIVTIFLVVFGLPLAFTGLTWPPGLLGAMALTMTYSAYVAEVYRAGLSSIHPSQSAAARSLGLSYSQTLRRVLIPQAVRRVIPPLLNDFISLQKDTALLAIAGVAEVLLTAQFWEAKTFSMAPVTLAAAFFIIITIPQARFVDWLIDRDAARRAGK